MIESCVMIRTLPGILFRRTEIEKFESTSTKVSAALITSEVSTFVVTAKAEQMPSTCRVIGFFTCSGSTRIAFVALFIRAHLAASPRTGHSRARPTRA